MKDGIIKANGTSRRVQATFPATYEEFRAKAAAGTLSLDVLFQSAGWSQHPTFLNKANLLDDTTAEMGGFDSNVVPNDVFRYLLGRPQPANGFSTDFYLFITGQHPLLSKNPYQDIDKVRWELFRPDLARTVSLDLTGNAQTVTFKVYDGGDL